MIHQEVSRKGYAVKMQCGAIVNAAVHDAPPEASKRCLDCRNAKRWRGSRGW